MMVMALELLGICTAYSLGTLPLLRYGERGSE
jgi:hypothetical protein